MTKTLVAPGGNSPIFEEHPITLGGWRLRHNGADPIGKPTYEQTRNALEFAMHASEVSPYWVGDIAAYAENRSDWHDRVSQLIAITGYQEQTIAHLATMARRVGARARAVSPSVSHAREVQALPEDRQVDWLTRARDEKWTRRELMLQVKASQKRGVVTGTAELAGMFRAWLIDFPWIYKTAEPSTVSAQTHYPGMTVEDGIAMGDTVRAHTQKDAVAFWWVTAPFLYYATDPALGPDAYRIMRAWGFEPKTGMVWDKVDHNFGNYVSVRHEHLIISTRGRCTPDRPVPMVDSVFTERRTRVHSEKPASVPTMIERLYDGPYVELFARRPRLGWVTWGNQILQNVG